MINAEKHKNELRTLFKLNKLQDCALRKGNGSFGNCYNIGCKNCMFNDKEGCTYALIKWMLSEYREPVKISKLEYGILEYLFKNKQYKFIVRERNGYLYAYINKPRKYDKAWQALTCMRSMSLFDDLFQFIQWEDEEPTSIEEVLDNCVVK